MIQQTSDADLARFAALRYASASFPPYRFLPGRDPHPTADPRGHSFRPRCEPESAVAPVAPEDWRSCEEYLLGCDLYNHAYWWEAHEEWEGLWRVVPRDGVQRRFLQGLIQVSACHLKLRLGSVQGVTQLRQSSRAHLEFVVAEIGTARFMGLNVADFLRRVEAYYDRRGFVAGITSPTRKRGHIGIRTATDGLGRHDPESFPYCRPAQDDVT